MRVQKSIHSLQRTKLCRSELAANDKLRRYYAPRPFLLLLRVSVLCHYDAFVTNFTAAKFRALYCTDIQTDDQILQKQLLYSRMCRCDEFDDTRDLRVQAFYERPRPESERTAERQRAGGAAIMTKPVPELARPETQRQRGGRDERAWDGDARDVETCLRFPRLHRKDVLYFGKHTLTKGQAYVALSCVKSL
ncbi:hypothetical protein EVAR_60884_1 [Eumeta japonica]|uniref:Uncharacterized protein n=1 Tax=Eumeta variegata TaxID=151549 RepID=A0A4C1YKK5_EUMVA|nr:hypothetical protein EVAR_60884_1 [Eumeta japonica]